MTPKDLLSSAWETKTNPPTAVHFGMTHVLLTQKVARDTQISLPAYGPFPFREGTGTVITDGIPKHAPW